MILKNWKWEERTAAAMTATKKAYDGRKPQNFNPIWPSSSPFRFGVLRCAIKEALRWSRWSNEKRLKFTKFNTIIFSNFLEKKKISKQKMMNHKMNKLKMCFGVKCLLPCGNCTCTYLPKTNEHTDDDDDDDAKKVILHKLFVCSSANWHRCWDSFRKVNQLPRCIQNEFQVNGIPKMQLQCVNYFIFTLILPRCWLP